MNAEMINELKGRYRQFLTTPEGRQQLTDAIKMKKMWKEQVADTDFQFNTASINRKKFDAYLNEKITKITITPIGLNNMCHSTSQFFCDEAMGITKRIGYNVTACPCGGMMSYELHSVNKCGGQLYDFTKDFNDETDKYFLEIDTEMPARTFIQMFGRNPIAINKGCRCRCKFNNLKQFLQTEDQMLEHIGYVESLQVRERNGCITIIRR